MSNTHHMRIKKTQKSLKMARTLVFTAKLQVTMNFIRNLVLLFCLALSISAHAQDIRSANGALIGRWNGGEYRSANGSLVYRYSHTGELRDGSGRLVLRVRGDDIRDARGTLKGRIGRNGEVRNQSGVLLGRIQENGDVRDHSGALIGRARDVLPLHVAFVLFFQD